MKRIHTFLVLSSCFLFLLLLPSRAHAVYVKDMPVKMVQPNGDTIRVFATGDECYHRYHDAQGYTLVMNDEGYWVYAQPTADGSIEPSEYVYGSINPADMGLTPGLVISRKEWLQRREAWRVPADKLPPVNKTSGRNHGDYCNLVIFIRFADDTGYTRSFTSINKMFNDSTTSNTTSLYNYFKHASYNKIYMRTYYAPAPSGNRILSYQSPHPRRYYMPYSQSNPDGYRGNQRSEREFDLLAGAVSYINQNAPVPSNVVLDCDGDGYIDNVNFIVMGDQTGWNDLLWPHKWNLYSRECYINGKRVSTFNFQLEGSGDSYFGTSTFCHEMFHSLGAPDLYRYNTGTDHTPVGGWDLMASNSRPPQHMSAYLKYKYGNWLDSIPTITTPGTYTLKSIGDSTNDSNCYKILSPDSNQYYVLEYRDNTEPFETGLPGKGLIIYRVDTRFEGNAGFDDDENIDEIWVFRPNSTSRYEDGQLAMAALSYQNNRTEFSPSGNIIPFLSEGQRDMSFSITSIGNAGRTITFHFSHRTVPVDLIAHRVTTSTSSIKWDGGANAYRIRYRKANSQDPYQYHVTTHKGTTITDLIPNTVYECQVRSLYGNNASHEYTDSSKYSNILTFHTEVCNNAITDTISHYTNNDRTGMPFVNNSNYNYSQQIFTADEMGEAKIISNIGFHYAHTTDLTKTNCSIYLAHTDISQFNDSNILTGNDLSLVFTGDITFKKGWNEIILDSSFYYDGEHNLVLAIDDNSGQPSRAGHHFYVNQTTNRMAVVYYGDNNPDPFSDSIVGSRYFQTYRTNVKFTGCPISSSKYYACIISDDPEMGSVRGEGYYDPGETITIRAIGTRGNKFSHWHDGNTENPRQITLTSDTVMVAFFKSKTGIEMPEENSGYTVASQHLTLSVSGAENYPIRIFDIMGRQLFFQSAPHPTTTTATLPRHGIYILKVGNASPHKILLTQ